jgi:hypothetical protein
MINHLVHAVCRHQRSRMSRMSRLAARFAATPMPTATNALLAGEPVRRRRLRGDRRILVVQGQLAFQISDALRLLRDLPFAFSEFLT